MNEEGFLDCKLTGIFGLIPCKFVGKGVVPWHAQHSYEATNVSVSKRPHDF